jgi:hypothetical protein
MVQNQRAIEKLLVIKRWQCFYNFYQRAIAASI